MRGWVRRLVVVSLFGERRDRMWTALAEEDVRGPAREPWPYSDVMICDMSESPSRNCDICRQSRGLVRPRKAAYPNALHTEGGSIRHRPVTCSCPRLGRKVSG
jgi:hypothetical protein